MGWLQTGPGPLDLTTPLAEGMKQGMMQAYRQDQIKNQADRVAEMNAALGLQQKEETFRENQWSSQAAMRDADLRIATSNSDILASHADQIAKGQPVLNAFLGNLHTTSPDDLNNLTPPAGLTSEQQDQAQKAIVDARQGQAARIAADVVSQNVLTTAQLHQAGLDPNNFTGTDGKLDLSAAGQALNDFKISQTQKEEDIKSTGQISVQQGKYTAMQPIVDARVKGQENIALLNTAERRQAAAYRSLNALQQKVAAGGTVDAATISAAKAEQAAADANYGAIQGQVSGGTPNVPGTGSVPVDAGTAAPPWTSVINGITGGQ